MTEEEVTEFGGGSDIETVDSVGDLRPNSVEPRGVEPVGSIFFTTSE